MFWCIFTVGFSFGKNPIFDAGFETATEFMFFPIMPVLIEIKLLDC